MITVINRPVLWCLFTKNWLISHSSEVSELNKTQQYKINSRKHWNTGTLAEIPLQSAFSIVLLLSLKLTETFITSYRLFHDMNVRMLLFFPFKDSPNSKDGFNNLANWTEHIAPLGRLSVLHSTITDLIR